MSKFVDVYLLPIKEEKIPAYQKMDEAAGKIFKKHGALKYREYVAADLEVQEVLPFPNVIKLEPGETIVYAAVEFDSKAKRDMAMTKIMEDPDLKDSMEGEEPPFDYKRMVYGGFSVIVDL